MDEDGYFIASVPSLPGCYTQAKTFEQVKKRIEEVIKLCLDEDIDLAQANPSSFVGFDRVSINYA